MKAKTASDFVREQPLTMKAKDVVSLGRRSGYPSMSRQQVYAVRSQAAAAAKKAEPSRYTESEREFMRLAMELGLAQSAQLVSGVRERIKAAL